MQDSHVGTGRIAPLLLATLLGPGCLATPRSDLDWSRISSRSLEERSAYARARAEEAAGISKTAGVAVTVSGIPIVAGAAAALGIAQAPLLYLPVAMWADENPRAVQALVAFALLDVAVFAGSAITSAAAAHSRDAWIRELDGILARADGDAIRGLRDRALRLREPPIGSKSGVAAASASRPGEGVHDARAGR